MNNYFPITINFPGVTDEEKDIYVTLPADMTLTGISAQCLDEDEIFYVENDGTQITDALTIPASTTPTTWNGRSDFVGSQYPIFKKGAVLHVNITGTDSVDIAIVLTFQP